MLVWVCFSFTSRELLKQSTLSYFIEKYSSNFVSTFYVLFFNMAISHVHKDSVSKSPDLNLIQQLWNKMKHQLYSRPYHLMSVLDLTNALGAIWEESQCSQVENLKPEEWYRMLQQCITAHGVRITYKRNVQASTCFFIQQHKKKIHLFNFNETICYNFKTLCIFSFENAAVA